MIIAHKISYRGPVKRFLYSLFVSYRPHPLSYERTGEKGSIAENMLIRLSCFSPTSKANIYKAELYLAEIYMGLSCFSPEIDDKAELLLAYMIRKYI